MRGYGHFRVRLASGRVDAMPRLLCGLEFAVNDILELLPAQFLPNMVTVDCAVCCHFEDGVDVRR